MFSALPTKFARRLAGLFLILMLVGIAPSLQADRIITDSGKTLEGIIVDENLYYVYLDVRGVTIPVPHERIRELTRFSTDENVKMLLDRAFEAKSRDDIIMARTLIEQARALNSTDIQNRTTLLQLDDELANIERRGGTLDERRRRAENLVREAVVAYDQVDNETGDDRLIEALRIEPRFEAGHRLFEQQWVAGGRDNLMLAARYFNEVLWPDQLREDSQVYEALPRIFNMLAERFEQARDIEAIRESVEWMRNIKEGISQNPQWIDAQADDAVLVQRDLLRVLNERVERNINQSLHQQAIFKLNEYTVPEESPRVAYLYARAYTGIQNFREAVTVLSDARMLNPEAELTAQMRPQINALRLILRAQEAMDSGQYTEASDTFRQIFSTQEQLIPEIEDFAGRRLAELNYGNLEIALSTRQPPWSPAEISLLYVLYGTDPTRQQRAAEVLNALLPTLVWDLNLTLKVNDVEVPTNPNSSPVAGALNNSMGLIFMPGSPFVLDYEIQLVVIGVESEEIERAFVTDVEDGATAPMEVRGINFNLRARHEFAGEMLQDEWASPGVAEVTMQLYEPENRPPEGVYVILNQYQDLIDFLNRDIVHYVTPPAGPITERLNIPNLDRILRTSTP